MIPFACLFRVAATKKSTEKTGCIDYQLIMTAGTLRQM